MAVKRKFDTELDDGAAQCGAKQLKLVPFPSSVLDSDAPITDDAAMDIDIDHSAHHTRLSSSTSSMSSGSPGSPNYPVFDLYPLAYDPPSPTAIGLMQPSQGTSFVHHSQNCTQIPKLRVACEAGPSGQRSMWTLCEDCGAIEMIES